MGKRAHFRGPVYGTACPIVQADAGFLEDVGSSVGGSIQPPFMRWLPGYSTTFKGHFSRLGWLGHSWYVDGIAAGTPDLEFSNTSAVMSRSVIANATITPSAGDTGYGVQCTSAAATQDSDIVGTGGLGLALGVSIPAVSSLQTPVPYIVNAASEGVTGFFHSNLGVFTQPVNISIAQAINGATANSTDMRGTSGIPRTLQGARVKGDWRHYVTTYPLPTVAASATGGTNQVENSLAMPISGRVIGAYWSATGSASGNNFDVFNSTKGTLHFGNQSVTSATFSSGYLTGSNVLNHDFDAGDVIQIRTDAASTAIDNLSVVLIIIPYALPDRAQYGMPATGLTADTGAVQTFLDFSANSRSRDYSRTGGFANLYFAPAATPGTGTNQLVRQITVPFDCRLEHLCFASVGSAASATLRLYNNTQGYAMTDDLSVSSGPSYDAEYHGWTSAGINSFDGQINRGDILYLQSTSASDQPDKLLVNAVVSVRGYPHDDPDLD